MTADKIFVWLRVELLVRPYECASDMGRAFACRKTIALQQCDERCFRGVADKGLIHRYTQTDKSLSDRADLAGNRCVTHAGFAKAGIDLIKYSVGETG